MWQGARQHRGPRNMPGEWRGGQDPAPGRFWARQTAREAPCGRTGVRDDAVLDDGPDHREGDADAVPAGGAQVRVAVAAGSGVWRNLDIPARAHTDGRVRGICMTGLHSAPMPWPGSSHAVKDRRQEACQGQTTGRREQYTQDAHWYVWPP